MAQRRSSKSRPAKLPRSCRQILEYLADNPMAGDTADGIVQWWLVERKLVEAEQAVRRALKVLVNRDLVTTAQAGDGRWHYRLNDEKTEEVHRLLADIKA